MKQQLWKDETVNIKKKETANKKKHHNQHQKLYHAKVAYASSSISNEGSANIKD